MSGSFFYLINSIIKKIEILIESNKLETYRISLRGILNNEDYLINLLYIKLIKLKNKIEELNKNENLEHKKIRRSIIQYKDINLEIFVTFIINFNAIN